MTRRVAIAWTGADAVRRRLVFEERSGGGWNRITQRHSAGEWVREGLEVVADMTVADATVAESEFGADYEVLHESDAGSLVEFGGEIHATIGDRQYSTEPEADRETWVGWDGATVEHGMTIDGVVERYCHYVTPAVGRSELYERACAATLSAASGEEAPEAIDDA